MAAIGTVLIVIGIEAFLLSSFQKSINKRNHVFAVASLIALITFMIIVNVEWFKGELRNQAAESAFIAWIVCGLLIGFIFAPKKYKSAISDVTSAWNSKTGNIFGVLAAISLFLAIRG